MAHEAGDAIPASASAGAHSLTAPAAFNDAYAATKVSRLYAVDLKVLDGITWGADFLCANIKGAHRAGARIDLNIGKAVQFMFHTEGPGGCDVLLLGGFDSVASDHKFITAELRSCGAFVAVSVPRAKNVTAAFKLISHRIDTKKAESWWNELKGRGAVMFWSNDDGDGAITVYRDRLSVVGFPSFEKATDAVEKLYREKLRHALVPVT
jgi:hypothetical protein